MCSCTSCEYTDTFSGWRYGENGELLIDPNRGGFNRWPTGEAKGPAKARAEYSAHVSHSFFGAIKRTGINADPATFYGTPKGLTRGEVRKILNAQFAAND